jgi:hypothetical protein
VVALEDAESQTIRYVDTSSRRARAEYRATAEGRVRERARTLAAAGIDHIDLYTDRPYAQTLMAFFRDRDQRVLHV